MKEQDYRLLELLLDQLGREFVANICILPNHIQDGYYIAVYNEAGERSEELQGPTIKSCVEQFQAVKINPQ